MKYSPFRNCLWYSKKEFNRFTVSWTTTNTAADKRESETQKKEHRNNSNAKIWHSIDFHLDMHLGKETKTAVNWFLKEYKLFNHYDLEYMCVMTFGSKKFRVSKKKSDFTLFVWEGLVFSFLFLAKLHCCKIISPYGRFLFYFPFIYFWPLEFPFLFSLAV